MSYHIRKTLLPHFPRYPQVLLTLKSCAFTTASPNFGTSSTHQQHQSSAETEREIQHHAKIASDWWNENGTLKALHALNKIRVPFIRDGLVARGTVDPGLVNTTRVLQQQQILEVGCGGGILTEPLARLGATMTGLDLGDDVISTACKHLHESSPELKQRITYKVEPIELHAKANQEKYNAIVVSEVLEHIDDKVAFLTACILSLKPGGSIFITTINKTLPMWVGGVLIGEYMLDLAPKGTHHWDKMITPLDVQRILDTFNCTTVLVNGSTYDFWNNNWRWVNCTSMCYALHAIKTV